MYQEDNITVKARLTKIRVMIKKIKTNNNDCNHLIMTKIKRIQICLKQVLEMAL